MNFLWNWWYSIRALVNKDAYMWKISKLSKWLDELKELYNDWKIALKMISWRKLKWKEYDLFVSEFKEIQKEYDEYFAEYDKIIKRYEDDERETWSIVVDTLEKLKRLYVDFSDLSDELENICFDNEKIEDLMYDVTNTKFALKEKEEWNTNGEYKDYLKYVHYLK